MSTNQQFEDERIADEICARREVNGQPVEVGTFVAIAEGRVVGVGNSFEEADERLIKSGIRPGQGIVCEVAEPALDVIR